MISLSTFKCFVLIRKKSQQREKPVFGPDITLDSHGSVTACSGIYHLFEKRNAPHRKSQWNSFSLMECSLIVGHLGFLLFPFFSSIFFQQ